MSKHMRQIELPMQGHRRRTFVLAMIAVLVLVAVVGFYSLAHLNAKPNTVERSVESPQAQVATTKTTPLAPKTGWTKDKDGQTRYYDPTTHEFLTGWQEMEGKRYYLTDDGTTLRGWQTIDGARHYFDEDGSMPMGWVTDNEGVTYWVKPEDGTLASHEWIEIDGVYQAFDDDGSWVTLGDVKPSEDDVRLASLSDRQRAVIDACDTTPWPGAALCAGWVTSVFQTAGEEPPGGDARDMARDWCYLDDLNALEPGMLVAVPSHSRTENGKTWGHVGIYVGNGIVRDSGSYAVRKCALGSWLAWFGVSEAPKWGWANGQPLA